MNLLSKFAIAIIVGSVSLSSLANPDLPNHRDESHIKRLTRLLDLSDSQVSTISEILSSNKPQRQGYHQSLKSLHQQLKAEGQLDTINETAIKQINQKIASVKSEIMLMKLKTKKLIEAELNEEQLIKWQTVAELRQERAMMRKKKRQMRRHHRQAH
ncbi:MAG: hypothetical protein V2I33_02175 [Kangiellaceae bacterium]|jgi:hypothetical protein|nr:hypothetical protein [Kangiellaceae bacterium]